MHPDTWARLGDLFSQVIEVPAADRAAWLDRACGGDTALRAELEKLLAGHGAGVHVGPDSLLPSSTPTPRIGPGDRIGPYRLDELIGRGGMGEVYRATRVDQQFDQLVAIKMVRAERSSPELVRRFLQERQIMAQLQHPNIASLLDGGLTDQGQPYLVLQYVEGVPITRYADEHGLDLEARLRLFVTVCDAVQFAHRHLVVHRDLKPSNILVDREGQPRLLDFGIAKLLDPSAAASTTGDLLLLTPEHAAPEQFLGSPVTTATDVYALGILLYELLTGTRPFRDVPPVDLARAVCEKEPERPGALRPIHGDLDSIVMMALRKEPGRRYASAGDLGADVLRFLGGWPVIAQPDTAGYRLRRFVGRNRVWVAAAALILVTLVTATGLIARESSRRAAALEVAQRERVRAGRITEFLLSVFRATNPNETRGRTVTARELLDQAAARIRRDLAREPEARADLELAIARAYGLLGSSFTADTIQTRLVAELRERQPVDTIALATVLEYYARTGAALGRIREGVPLLREVIALRERKQGPESPDLASPYHRLGIMLMQLDPEDRDSGSRKAFDRALDLYRKADTLNTRATIDVLRFKATIAGDRDEPAEALRIMKEAVATMEKVTAPDDPFRFNVYETYALNLQANGLADSAIAIHRRNLADRRRVFGPEHPDVTFSLYNLARDLGRVNRFEESLPLFRECVAIREKVFGPMNIQTAFALGAMGRATAASGDREGALPLFRRAAVVAETSFGPESYDAIRFNEDLALLLTSMGRRDDALGILATMVDRGYRDIGRKEWEPISADPRFRALAARATADSSATR